MALKPLLDLRVPLLSIVCEPYAGDASGSTWCGYNVNNVGMASCPEFLVKLVGECPKRGRRACTIGAKAVYERGQ